LPVLSFQDQFVREINGRLNLEDEDLRRVMRSVVWSSLLGLVDILPENVSSLSHFEMSRTTSAIVPVRIL